MVEASRAQGFARQLATELKLPFEDSAESGRVVTLLSDGSNRIELSLTVSSDHQIRLTIGASLDQGPTLQSLVDVRDEASCRVLKEVVASALQGSMTESITRRDGEIIHHELKSPQTTMTEQAGLNSEGETETRGFAAYPPRF